ncbi:hypothetical protein ES677_12560 [Bizionia gelidisalsuginis]|uniref:Uncharacterized protein n=1 Tax=Bizionia gelidisalsuginis TaxID=291188 RepID=A0ABY3M8A3_9FLAO|nr:hypothetical protein [Bizionia gelidisalsuginis]TYC09745.1 hypothetical protein ES677_12560 [Bizionia gelidisalsuginis]
MPTLNAELTIGLNKGYFSRRWSLNELKSIVTHAQLILKGTKAYFLSAKVTLCDIVYLYNKEPSVTVNFINYPKFPYKEASFKSGV